MFKKQKYEAIAAILVVPTLLAVLGLIMEAPVGLIVGFCVVGFAIMVVFVHKLDDIAHYLFDDFEG